jgi:hypothetical protein
MILSQFRDHFLTRYKIECLKRQVKEIDLENQGKIIAMIAYDAMNDIQSRLGAIDNLAVISLTQDNKYPLPLDFGYVKSVEYSGHPLNSKSSAWIKERYSQIAGIPYYYAIDTPINAGVISDDDQEIITDDNGQIPSSGGTNSYIILSPIPSINEVDKNLYINYQIDIKLFNPEINNDIYDSTMIFPSVYDKAVLNFMIDSMFYTEEKPNYKAEIIKLLGKQFSGEGIEYDMNVFEDRHRGYSRHDRHGAI